MFDPPKFLPHAATPSCFTPDPSLAWVVVYAASCEDPECEENHRRLFIIPVIGWGQFYFDDDSSEWREEREALRPMIMLGDGVVKDYLDMPSMFRFISVLRAGQDVPALARDIYAEVYGETEAEKITEISEGRLSN